MIKYSSLFLTASIWLFTVLCVSVASAAALNINSEPPAYHYNGNIWTAYKELSNIKQSSNAYIKFIRDMANKFIDSFDKKKKLLLVAVAGGMEMEKQIRNISLTLKNSTIPLSAKLQSELEEIEKHTATELKKLKEMENVEDVDEIQKKYKFKFEEIREQIEYISKLAIEANETIGEQNMTKVNEANLEKAKAKVIDLTQTCFKVLFMNKDLDTISKKLNIASDVFSNIQNDLVKVEKIEYHALLLQDNFKTDTASSIRSSWVYFAFAIMFAILLKNSDAYEI